MRADLASRVEVVGGSFLEAESLPVAQVSVVLGAAVVPCVIVVCTRGQSSTASRATRAQKNSLLTLTGRWGGARCHGQDGDAYLLRYILHDWPAKEVEHILKNVRAAMGSAKVTTVWLVSTALMTMARRTTIRCSCCGQGGTCDLSPSQFRPC